jgi:hypothetical protein
MPGKRPVKKGSFGSHFDEVVKHFPHEELSDREGEKHRKPSTDDGDVHDKLFESAWHKARRAQSSSFSNQ